MPDEKPMTERVGSDEERTAGEMDGAMAALSALSNAAAPVRESEPGTREVAPEPEEVPVPESVTVEVVEELGASDATSEDAPPPPPPAPESAVDPYPAPTGAPVAVSPAAPTVATAAAEAAPAPAPKRRRWPWILALCIVAGFVMLGGIFACASNVMRATFHAVQHNERHYDFDDLFNHDEQDGLWNYYYGGMDVTFDGLLDIFNIKAGEITDNGVYAGGAYRVGGENGIAPGLYYLEGSQNGVSNFFVFRNIGGTEDDSYDLQASAEYFGNYYVEVAAGDALFFIPFDDASTMFLASDQPMDVMPPYKSGCYRVGIDIPAGTYTITCDSELARLSDSEAGAYVMDDVFFEADEPFVSESVYVIKGGRQTISVDDGEYLELFASIATPATASTKVPLQHVESELPYVA